MCAGQRTCAPPVGSSPAPSSECQPPRRARRRRCGSARTHPPAHEAYRFFSVSVVMAEHWQGTGRPAASNAKHCWSLTMGAFVTAKKGCCRVRTCRWQRQQKKAPQEQVILLQPSDFWMAMPHEGQRLLVSCSRHNPVTSCNLTTPAELAPLGSLLPKHCLNPQPTHASQPKSPQHLKPTRSVVAQPHPACSQRLRGVPHSKPSSVPHRTWKTEQRLRALNWGRTHEPGCARGRGTPARAAAARPRPRARPTCARAAASASSPRSCTAPGHHHAHPGHTTSAVQTITSLLGAQGELC